VNNPRSASQRFPISQDRLADFCRRWRISELSLFGSALREDFRPDSDVDLLVSFAPGVSWGFDEYLTMKGELEALLGRTVDLVERRLVETSENYIRLTAALERLVPPEDTSR
jgi:hypothetical protein